MNAKGPRSRALFGAAVMAAVLGLSGWALIGDKLKEVTFKQYFKFGAGIIAERHQRISLSVYGWERQVEDQRRRDCGLPPGPSQERPYQLLISRLSFRVRLVSQASQHHLRYLSELELPIVRLCGLTGSLSDAGRADLSCRRGMDFN